MNQANALKLQQSLKEKESELEQCYLRMEKGEPPSEEIERDWLKYLRDEERRAYENEEKRLVSVVMLILYTRREIHSLVRYHSHSEDVFNSTPCISMLLHFSV